MSESLVSSETENQKRRSTRVVQAIPITVTGVDALGQPFKERTTTIMVNCHGCKYQSKHYVPKNSTVTLEIPRPEPAYPPRVVPGRVVWVQRPRTVRELFQIGLEFEISANVWGIAFPPEDWDPAPVDDPATIPTPEQVAAALQAMSPAQEPEKKPHAKPQPSASSPAPAITSPKPAAPPASSIAPQQTAPQAADAKVRVMPSPAQAQEAQLAAARAMAKMVADTKETLEKSLRKSAQSAINDEMVIVRTQMDAQLHETVERAIKNSMERVSEHEVKKVVQQAAERTAAIVEDARKTTENGIAQLDARIKQAVQESVSHAAEQAAHEAIERSSSQNLKQAVEEALAIAVPQAVAEAVGKATTERGETERATVQNLKQTVDEAIAATVPQAVAEAVGKATGERADAERATAQNLKQTVDEAIATSVPQAVSQAVNKAIAEREAISPSLQILSSPEVAQKHLDDWKKSLEDAAQTVRNQTIAESQNSANEATRHWQEGLDAAIAAAALKISDRLADASHTSIARAEQDIAARGSSFTSQLDEIVASNQATIQSLGASLEQERARAEETRAQIQEIGKSGIEQVQHRLDEMLAAKYAEIEAQAQRAVADRAQLIEPALENSAQKAIEHFSMSIDEKMEAKLGDMQKALGELANAGQQVVHLQTTIREQFQQAVEKAAEIQQNVRAQVQQASDETARKAIGELASASQQAAQVQSGLREMMQQVSQQSADIQQTIRAQAQQLSDEIVKKSVAEVTNATQQALHAQNSLREQLQQASENAARIHENLRAQVQATSDEAVRKAGAQISGVSQQAIELQNQLRDQVQQISKEHSGIQDSIRAQVRQASDDAVKMSLAEVSNATQQATLVRDSIQMQIKNASEQAGKIQQSVHEQIQLASEQAANVQETVQEQVQRASAKAISEAIAQIEQQTAKYPAQFELACRASIAKLEEELAQKSSETQHETFEALVKAADWYQKKAQTTMQSSLEKTVELSSTTLRDRAAEISSLVASELDHYRRSYVDHSRGEIEEVAKSVVDRERAKLNENAAVAGATFTNQVNQAAHDMLKRFEEASRELMKIAADGMGRQRDGSLAEFQSALEDTISDAVEQARTYLQSQLVPLIEDWNAKREVEKDEWMTEVKKTSEESIEQYKARLENASNSWLLASATTLGQSSQAVIDTLAKAAEKRLRETCGQVLAGMGDVLKERLIGLSTAFTPAETEASSSKATAPPKKP